eukprot:218712-Pelagomonas_calceolata.AAC.1
MKQETPTSMSWFCKALSKAVRPSEEVEKEFCPCKPSSASAQFIMSHIHPTTLQQNPQALRKTMTACTGPHGRTRPLMFQAASSGTA